MKTKEIIKKLEAVVCELKDEEKDGAYLDEYDNWVESSLTEEQIIDSYKFVCSTNLHMLYADFECRMLYRIRK